MNKSIDTFGKHPIRENLIRQYENGGIGVVDGYGIPSGLFRRSPLLQAHQLQRAQLRKMQKESRKAGKQESRKDSSDKGYFATLWEQEGNTLVKTMA